MINLQYSIDSSDYAAFKQAVDDLLDKPNVYIQSHPELNVLKIVAVDDDEQITITFYGNTVPESFDEDFSDAYNIGNGAIL